MPSTVSLGSMLTAAQQRSNQENLVLAANSVITLPEERGYFNEAIAELYDLLIQARPEYYRKSVTFNTTSNQSGYPVPSDFYQMISVDINLGGNLFITARPYMESERNAFRWNSAWYYDTPVYWRLQGTPDSTGANLAPSNINFIPSPNSNFAVTLNYAPCFRPYLIDGTEDDNVFDGINGWDGFAVWTVTAIMLEKLKQDSSFARAQIEKYTKRIEALANDRHAGDAERVHDSLADGTMSGFSGNY